MRAQVHVIFRQAMDPETLLSPKYPIWDASGLAGGVLVNCDTDEALLRTLQYASEVGHHAAVKVLAEDEPYPVRADWIEKAAADE